MKNVPFILKKQEIRNKDNELSREQLKHISGGTGKKNEQSTEPDTLCEDSDGNPSWDD